MKKIVFFLTAMMSVVLLSVPAAYSDDKTKNSQKETTKMEKVAKQYNCLCTKCNHNWVSTGKPTKCPNCGSKQIVYNERESTSKNTVIEENFIAVVETPLCAQKINTSTTTVAFYSCIEKDLICILHGTPCCAPYECKGTFPNTYCK
ncbi:hypothetical protein KKG48_00065 [Patescibacteria group bacterium]|nr:hypothetical protein [Patescibacteria group bacterium]MCG2694497.1 hypothetical protein [Candidatus Parcubacteria bacterium]